MSREGTHVWKADISQNQIFLKDQAMKNINTTSKFCQPRRSNAVVIFKKVGPAIRQLKCPRPLSGVEWR